MTTYPARPLPDPAHVTSSLQLVLAAKELMACLDLSGSRVAKKGNLSTGTVSGLVNGRVFPREATFEAFITAGCGQTWEPWRQAWQRAHQDDLHRRPSESLAAEVHETQSRVEVLEQALAAAVERLAELEERVTASLDARHADEAAEREEARRRTDAMDQLLEAIPAPRFTVERWDHRDTGSLPLYDISAVDKFLQEVRTRSNESLLKHLLRTHPGTFRDPGGGQTCGYRAFEVDLYMSELRLALGIDSPAPYRLPDPARQLRHGQQQSQTGRGVEPETEVAEFSD
ncbi:hypothetical protein [Streptomyces sp. NPDC086787]|uniref:hypothetical protein n=1 Tax=Streptomyces sp. NPDC086787 TaxID=3365759 RepID=UPI0038108873